MVLATPHLSSYSKEFSSRALDPVIQKLKNWGPDLICIESAAPGSMNFMIQNPVLYRSVLNEFGKENQSLANYFQEKKNCDWQTAMKRYDSLGRQLQVDPNNSVNKVAFTQYSFASYRFYTALLQYKTLNAQELVNLGLDEDKKNVLENTLASSNENVQLGFRLAQEMEKNEILQIDDHLDKDLFMRIAPALINELNSNKEYQKIHEDPFYKETQQKLLTGLEEKNLLPYYRMINTSVHQKKDKEVQWELFFRTNLDSRLDRVRVGLWETRNLNICSHIRRASSLYPGRKVLVIIGSSHKIFLDEQLQRLMGVKLVNFNDI